MRIENPKVKTSGNVYHGFTRNITKISTHGWAGGLIIADGKVFTFNGTEGNINWTRGIYPDTGNEGSGLLNTREVLFPGETGTLVDAGMQSVQGYALFDNGNLWMWGWGGQGQLGVGNTTSRFIPVLSTTNVVRFYSHPSQDSRDDDNSHYFVLKTDGKVYGTGYNGFGQLGLGNTTQQNSWVEIPAIGTNPIGVWPLGSYTGATFVQKSDGSIWVCGYGAYGQLGLGNTTSENSTLTNTVNAWNGGDITMRIQEIGFGGGYYDGANTIENTTIAMFLDNGTSSRVATCGNNGWGQLGDTTTTQRSTPIVPTGISGRVQKMIWLGSAPGSCWILRTNGTLWNWGYNLNGALDRGNTTQNITTPAQVETGILDMFIHNYTTLNYSYRVASPIILKSDGYYRCGYNNHGQLGDGTITERTTLVKMRFPQGIVFKMFGVANSVGNERPCFYGVDTTNKIWAWGDNSAYGIVSVGDAGYMPQPVQITPASLIR